MIKEAIVLRIQNICKERNIKFNDLAVRSGVTPSTTGRAESNFYRPTQALFGAFPFFRLVGRQPDCISKRKNPSKISLRRVRAVFTVRIFGMTTKEPQ